MRPGQVGEVDFAAVLPVLSAGQRHWLAEAVSRVHGGEHPWLPRLTA